MCGIVGVFDTKKRTTLEHLRSMTDSISHRGPDDSGEYVDGSGRLLFGHQRLSIIDLSSSGHQPMSVGRFTITYNGEIYNFKEIKEELKQSGINFKGGSDTEVLLQAWQKWGEASVKKLRGMFAFAIWDAKEEKLFLYRDRMGVKPLYYYLCDGLFIFASEIKAILHHPRVKRELDQDALALFLELGYIPAPHSIFRHIRKLRPAHFLTVDSLLRVEERAYWDINSVASGVGESEEAVLQNLQKLLVESCNLRMIADVPVGVFLSGGIDSSLVTALLKQGGHDNVSTFTIGFTDHTYDESSYARKIATYLGTRHHELICTPEEAKDIIPQLSHIYDEPFADDSAIPTYLLAKFARKEVTAALSADGGDEVFGGYERYNTTNRLYQKFGRSPLPSALGKLLPASVGGKWRLAADLLSAKNNLPGTYAVLRRYFRDTDIDRLILGASSRRATDLYRELDIRGKEREIIERLERIDSLSYLPDDVLVKVDRATMAVGLEGREPLLDHKLIEYVNGIPYHIKHKIPGQKYLLRQLLYKMLPPELVDRPKKGFGVPLGDWLRSDLKNYLDKYLDPALVRQGGVLSADFVAKEKEKFLSGKSSFNRVWNLVVFQMWYEAWM